MRAVDVDLDTEYAQTYIRNMRQIARLGREPAMRRPPINAEEAARMRIINAIIGRETFGYHGPASGDDTESAAKDACFRCGRTFEQAADARLVGSMYTKRGRIDKRVCRDGCSARREVSV